MKKLILNLIKIYRKTISPLLPSSCRFYPTCSEYGYLAIETFGVSRGSVLIIKRLMKCHPFNIGGYDPIPINTNELDITNNTN